MARGGYPNALLVEAANVQVAESGLPEGPTLGALVASWWGWRRRLVSPQDRRAMAQWIDELGYATKGVRDYYLGLCDGPA